MRLRGFGLVETLAALAVTGALLGLLSGVLFQAATAAEKQDKITDRIEAETAARLMLGARLDSIALVAEEAGARRPHFEVSTSRLVFVTQFAPRAALTGLWEVTVDTSEDDLRVTLRDWPKLRSVETVSLSVPGVRFAAEGMDAVAEGLPMAVVMDLPSGLVRLPLGAHLPLDCILRLEPPQRGAHALLCPGQGS